MVTTAQPEQKRITLFAGHYGSGKTNLAVNYAVNLKKRHERVVLADLDIVNPYFRTKDSEALLKESGIKLISSPYANTNVDLPGMSPETNIIFENEDMFSVIDLGGDDRGAYALGRYAGKLSRTGYEALFVFNHYRPMTRETDGAVEIMRGIESAGHFQFTGIVNNSNLGAETLPEDVLNSVRYVKRLSDETGLPVRFTSGTDTGLSGLAGKIPDLFPIQIMLKPQWIL